MLSISIVLGPHSEFYCRILPPDSRAIAFESSTGKDLQADQPQEDSDEGDVDGEDVDGEDVEGEAWRERRGWRGVEGEAWTERCGRRGVEGEVPMENREVEPAPLQAPKGRYIPAQGGGGWRAFFARRVAGTLGYKPREARAL
jgi:hypothetical protein